MNTSQSNIIAALIYIKTNWT